MARNKRYIRINERILDVYKILAALDDAAIEYEWLGHDKDISVIEINVGNMWKTYDDAVGEEELPVCEHCGSILAHPCDCQLYSGEEE